jgi:hypothetical protein
MREPMATADASDTDVINDLRVIFGETTVADLIILDCYFRYGRAGNTDYSLIT